jgi:predicted RecA/RadA family phage recombinase
MQATFLHDGCSIDHRPTVDLPAGTVVLLGGLVGITERPIAANTLGSLALDGVFAVVRTPGADVPRGTRHFWDAAAQQVVTNDGGGANPYLGMNTTDAASADTIVPLRLNR